MNEEQPGMTREQALEHLFLAALKAPLPDAVHQVTRRAFNIVRERLVSPQDTKNTETSKEK